MKKFTNKIAQKYHSFIFSLLMDARRDEMTFQRIMALMEAE